VTTSHVTATAYDTVGNRTSVTDPEGKITQYTYDALNRLIKITDPANGVTEHSYDNRDNLIALKDPRDNSHRFDYDKNNKKTKEMRPMGQPITLVYDSIGNLIQVTDPKGQVRKYTYDDVGRLIAETHYGTNSTIPAKTITYSYNERNKMTGYDDGTTSATYTYDNLQRKIQETVNYGPFSLSYSYNYYANGLKKSFTGPDGIANSYTYDNNNQLSSIQLPIGAITVNSYQWAAPTQITLPGGTIRQQQYDPLMRLTGITVKDASQSLAMSYQYTYDKAGNILTNNTEQGSSTYLYDRLYQLTQAAYPNLPTDTYTYDPIGNRLTDTQVTGQWTYDANNQLGTYGNVILAYDATGNIIQKTDGSQITQYLYDTADRLTDVKNTEGNTIARYYYDPYGKRLWKEVNNQKTHFLYTDEGLIGEYDQTGSQNKVYGYRPDGTWGTDPIYFKTGTNYYFYQNDRMGVPQKLVALNGSVVWNAKAPAFGLTAVDPSSTIINNLRFPGQYFDEETGLHYNWNRYYDPKLGRYITSDPIGLYDGLNTYVYVRSNPLKRRDPTGLNVDFCDTEFGTGCYIDQPPSCIYDLSTCTDWHDPGNPRVACTVRCSLIKILFSVGAEEGLNHTIGKVLKVCAKMVLRWGFLVHDAHGIYECYKECPDKEECHDCQANK